MKDETIELLERTFNFGVNMLRFLASLPKRFIYSVPRNQLAKSSTSIGSNYEEAQAGESKKDFIHKIGIMLKESRESHYWLRVLEAVYQEKTGHEQIQGFLRESTELKKIFASILITAKKA